MKKIMTIALCALLVVFLAVPALAAGSAALTPSSTSVYRGATFTVAVKLSGTEVASGGSIKVTVDDAFKITKGEWTISGAQGFFEADTGTGVFMNSSGKVDINGKVFVLTLKTDSAVAFGTYKIAVQMQINGEDIVKETSVKVTCKHSYGAWTKASDTKHSRTCTICGHVATADHTYTNDCDTSCNDCGASRIITHAFSEEWTSDETAHWHVCSVCGEIEGKADHVPGAEAGEYTDQLCTECGYVITPALGHQHNYGDSYHSDDVFHWQACLGCQEKTEAQRHVFDDDCDESCNICGYLRRVIHNECETPKFNTTVHWTVCDDCGLELSQGDHIWDGGTVLQEPDTEHEGTVVFHCGLCDAEKTESIPKIEKISTIAWWVWMLIGGGVGIVLTVAVGLIIILAGVGSKRKKGKFAN